MQDIALPEPLTDAEHAEHVKDVRDRLDKARVRGLYTDQQHTIDRAREVWSEERDALHDSIIEDLYAKAADVPRERRAIIAGGLSGAGKSTVLDEYADIDRSQYLTINPDKIKEEMADRGMVPLVDGLSPMRIMQNPPPPRSMILGPAGQRHASRSRFGVLHNPPWKHRTLCTRNPRTLPGS